MSTRFKILETYLRSKDDLDENCEDGMFVSEQVVAVYDGATAKSEPLVDGIKSGRFIRKWLDRVLPEVSGNVNSDNVISTLTRLLASEWSARGLTAPFPSASIAIAFAKERKIVICGDVQLLVNGEKKIISEKKIDYVLGEIRALAHLLNEEPVGSAMGRKYIEPLLHLQFKLANATTNNGYEFAVLNGTHVPSKLVKSVSFENGDSITLASDGYIQLHPDLATSEAQLADTLTRDPDLINISRQTKGVLGTNISFDDRCFLSFKVLE